MDSWIWMVRLLVLKHQSPKTSSRALRRLNSRQACFFSVYPSVFTFLTKFSRFDGHAVWANTLALKMAEVEKYDTSFKAFIDVDSNGIPTGILHELAANTAYKSVPPLTTAAKVKALSDSLQNLLELGITSYQVKLSI